MTSGELLEALALAHFLGIAACIIATRIYLWLTGYFASLLRWWSLALFFTLILHFNRLVLGVGDAGLIFLVVESCISNIANLALIAMAREVRGLGTIRHRTRSSNFLLLLVAVLPVLVFACVQIPGLRIPIEIQKALVRLPAALLSVYAVFKAGKELGKYLISLRKAVTLTFAIWSFYQFFDWIFPLLRNTPFRQTAEAIYLDLSLPFKIACTYALIAAASEYSRRTQVRELLDSGMLESRLEPSDAVSGGVPMPLFEDFDRRVVVVWSGGDERALERAKATLVRERLVPEVILAKERLDSPHRAAGLLMGSKYGLVMMDRTPSRTLGELSGLFLSSRKDCLILIRDNVAAGREFGNVGRIVFDYHSEKDLDAIVSKWVRKTVLPPIEGFKKSMVAGLSSVGR